MLIKVKGLSKPHGGRFVVEKRKSPHPNREELENEEPARRLGASGQQAQRVEDGSDITTEVHSLNPSTNQTTSDPQVV
jgi:hypothetical protein